MPISKQINIEELFQNNCQQLTNYIRRKISINEDAEDIVQNAFIRMQTTASQSDISNPISYLYQTATNILIDMKRREKLHNAYLHSVVGANTGNTNTTEYTQSSPGPDRVLAAQNKLKRIQAIVDKMPPKQRQAFILHRMKGLTYAEIAEHMQLSVSSVEKYIFTALKQCRKALSEEA